MKVIICENYEELSRTACGIMLETVKGNPYAVLGLATGTTPVKLYELMVKDHIENGTSYKNISAVNLDEYCGLDGENEQSYRYFMKKNLFGKIDIDPKNTYIENGKAADRDKECARYNALLLKLKRDIQLLGLGSNGHIAFNEPETPFDSETHVVKLTENTVNDNSRLFKDKSEVPRYAFTMGIKNILDAKKILILANGKNKAEAVLGTVRGKITESLPASILQTHPDCTLICDREAASLL